MYEHTLTSEQEIKVRTELCHEDHCLRCNIPLVKAEDRFLAQTLYRTKKHQYVNCFVVCYTCHEDKKGTPLWFDNLDDQELLYIAKDRACSSITIK